MASSASRHRNAHSPKRLDPDDLPSPRRYSFAQSSNPSDHSSCGTSPSVKTFSMNNNDCVGSVKEYFVEKTCYWHIIRFSLTCPEKIEPDERGGSGLALTIICLILGLSILTSVLGLLSESVGGLTRVELMRCMTFRIPDGSCCEVNQRKITLQIWPNASRHVASIKKWPRIAPRERVSSRSSYHPLRPPLVHAVRMELTGLTTAH